MLNDKYDIAAPWRVLKYLPVLDLEMTAPLCGAVLMQVHGDIIKVYRPKADDRRGPTANCWNGSALTNH